MVRLKHVTSFDRYTRIPTHYVKGGVLQCQLSLREGAETK